MGALDHIVKSGRALYVGISSYNSQRTKEAVKILKDLGTPCLIHQPSYNMFNRWIEEDSLLDTLEALGIGSIAFTPLAQGMLTKKYLSGVPNDSRAMQSKSLDRNKLKPELIEALNSLNNIASSRGQSLAQMALAWVLRGSRVTTALIGASKPEQIIDCVGVIENLNFTEDELLKIERLSGDLDINLRAASSEV